MDVEIARLFSSSAGDREKAFALIDEYWNNEDDDEVPDSDDDFDCDLELLRPPDSDEERESNDSFELSQLSQGVQDMELTELTEARNSPESSVSERECYDNSRDLIVLKAQQFKCNCQHYQNGPCSQMFSPEEMANMKMDMAAYPYREQNMMLLGLIAAGIKVSDMTCNSKQKRQKDREHPRTIYMHEGQQICISTFKFIFGISNPRLHRLRKHYAENGLIPIESAAGGSRSKNAVSFEDTQKLVQFIRNYAEDHALVLPGRVPGVWRNDVVLLPSSHTKTFVYNKYTDAMEGVGRVVGRSSFYSLWKQLLPDILTCRPMTDLCWECQNNMTLIYRSSNLNEDQKSARLKQHEFHLERVGEERTFYKSMVEEAKKICTSLGVTELSTSAPCSQLVSMHYSFDFAQQVHLPSDPLQPGPMYFLTPRKLGLFGVCCEGIPKQVNYLVDEAHCSTKGSNAVISYLDHFFEFHSLGETDVHLHCDNCSGQNKNKYVLWYLAYRVIIGGHQSVTLNFMIPGHTKFSPDWGFGLLKQAFYTGKVSTVSCMETLVNESAVSNVAQVIGYEDGRASMPNRDWQTFLSPHGKALKGIKSLHHMRFTSAEPGVVYYRQRPRDPEESLRILSTAISTSSPPPLPPPGLDLRRQKYLYQKIRPFVPEEHQDTLCPAPDCDVGPTSEEDEGPPPTPPPPRLLHLSLLLHLPLLQPYPLDHLLRGRIEPLSQL
ncbi:hypothetical protein CAPTEDRAFT_187019 [Capitella teleta]|uniref:DUF7869 domain-containing protein n=1 Tax=Capitella teleta TaxID=283909 RepID=R7UWW5_CAPTE|nr:hypothetical protein CAPTEDRAFT_187019 [Capitella teleta]|eukprot:ELU10752.1 hypothetical protein CAPTEDRAFT_187019 [Capitella teleta]